MPTFWSPIKAHIGLKNRLQLVRVDGEFDHESHDFVKDDAHFSSPCA